MACAHYLPASLATALKRPPLPRPQLFYAFCMAIGISPMDGTKDALHMQEDMALMERLRNGKKIFESSEELAVIGNALGIPEWNAEDEL